MSRIPGKVTVATVAIAAAFCGTASAATISVEGTVLVYRGEPGQDIVSVEPGDVAGTVKLTADNVAPASKPATCTDGYVAAEQTCSLAGIAAIRVELGTGIDSGSTSGTVGVPVAFLLGDGDDNYYGSDETATTADGGPGNDKLNGGAAAEAFEGGPGNDILEGHGGADTLRGGLGNDRLGGDTNAAMAADVIDGGADYDTVEDGYWDMSGGSQSIDLTLDGQANDGRPGEGDNVVAVEKIDLTLYGRYVGSDAAEDFDVGDADHQTTVLALGGDDIVLTSVGDDVIDGGTGNDNIQGNRGNDTITGGPGRDTINGDNNSVCTSLVCIPGASNDVIQARDGEVDQVACGFGTDRVVADAVDVVSGDCEAVDRGSASGPGSPTDPAGAASPVTLPKTLSLKTLRTSGLKIKVACAGPCSVSSTLTASASIGRKLGLRRAPRTVASGKGRTTKAGTATVTLKAAKSVRSKLKRLRKTSFTLKTKLTPKGGKSTTFTQTVQLR